MAGDTCVQCVQQFYYQLRYNYFAAYIHYQNAFISGGVENVYVFFENALLKPELDAINKKFPDAGRCHEKKSGIDGAV